MRNLIKKILRESDDFDWIRDIEMESNLSPAQIVNRYESAFPSNVVGPMVMEGFSDIWYEGGKYILKTDGWSDFVDLFKDVHSDYGYMGRYLAKSVLTDDDYWEPYDSHDLVSDWLDQVWSMVANDKELYNYVVNWIGNNLIGDEMRFEGEETTLTKEYLLEWSADSDVLGEMIDELDVFEDVKINLTWSYGDAYNQASADDFTNSAVGAITDDFGKGEWESKTINRNGEERTQYRLVFDVTDLLEDVVVEYIEDCWANCRKYWSPDDEYPDENGLSKEEAFEDYCSECSDAPFNEYSTFIYFYSVVLDNQGEEYNPRYNEYPDEDKITDYFKDSFYNRF